ncbi:MAG: hypothetical protein WA943_11185 [Parvibaculum sp.]|uniref:hypothetical protein n=1 Tax=Parvibaculum sp. TaxID=2024848 RepID=UPI003C73FB8D
MQLTEYANEALALARQGFDTVSSVQGIIIAVIAAALMRTYSQVIGWALGATIIHEAVTIARHAIANEGVTIPDFTNMEVLKLTAIRFVGYLVAISLIYLIRRIFLRS